MPERKKWTVVDLFAGCGGMSRGFQRTGRFGTSLAVELEPHFARTFEANISGPDGDAPRVFTGDIEDLLSDEIELEAAIEAACQTSGQVDVLIGGPPCQGFSRNGVRQYQDMSREVRFYDDPRNHLYKSFLRFVELLRPRLILIENVREFLNFGEGKFSQDLLAKLSELGYDATFKKICAADYGVPQMRHRVFFVATDKSISGTARPEDLFPKATHFKSGKDELFSENNYVTVREAISDLPSPSEQKDHEPIPYQRNGKVSGFGAAMRSAGGSVENHFLRQLSAKQVERINAIGTGRMRDAPEKLKTKAFYGSAYRRLAWDEPSLTITTWVYHVGSGRFAHPTEDRGLTMREAARLQSFDDEFVFPPLVNPVSRMIGNAVPPLLAKLFAEKFDSALSKASD